MASTDSLRARLSAGLVIPACPLALTRNRRSLDERRQRALIRYYRAAGAGGIAVGVHTTQFAIRDPNIQLYEPVLRIASEAMRESTPHSSYQHRRPLVRIAGICGATPQARAEAQLARTLGYEAGLLSLAALPRASEKELVRHARSIASEIPIVGFYLQPAVGGRRLSYRFWREFAGIENVVAIKIAPFNRYQTLDVVRAVVESGREDIALYTGNDDAIVADLTTPFEFDVGGRRTTRFIVGGLLGHWAVWTRAAVELHARCRSQITAGKAIPSALLRDGVAVTDMNAALFDAANGFAGCIAGIHEVLRRQGLFAGTWCLDPEETLSPGQARELSRVMRAYPELTDDAFIAKHRDAWLS